MAGPSEQDPDQPAEVHTVTDLEQIKVMADPLRIRILEQFCEEARTTKQVAERLGEKPTRLYHHVDALERVGLIRLAQTRQNRGTVEKYYRAVAKMFRADPGLFGTPERPEQRSTLRDLVETMMQNTTADLRRVIDSGVDISSGEQGVLGYVELHATAEEIAEVQETLLALLRKAEERAAEDRESEGRRRFRLTVAYFPLDPEAGKS